MSTETRQLDTTELEQRVKRPPECYAEDFVDHVNGLEFRGLEGVRRSTVLYQALFDDLRIDVVDQVADGDEVANRWVLRGTSRGREVELTGITISRLRDGRIVEDWTATDVAGSSPVAHPPRRGAARAPRDASASEVVDALPPASSTWPTVRAGINSGDAA
jgi:predicted ester cyclase